MTVLKAILEWSQERPVWQQDALRRLVETGDLDENDIRELVEICKATHGLAEPQKSAPLAADHIPGTTAKSGNVTLASIFHYRGVNALAENQTLKFSPGLTVVYGDNAAGKTGYIRILKSACRTRGQESILGNVISGTSPATPVVAIKYKVGTETEVREWAGPAQDDFISRVSVFDTQSAGVYVSEKTDVAFRPFGLDLFDKLVKACKAVRSRLEGEQHSLSAPTLGSLQLLIQEGTAAARLVNGLSSLTNPEAVKALAKLSTEDESRLALLEKSLLDFQAHDPEKLARQLDVRASRVRSLAQHLRDVQAALSPEAVAKMWDVRAEGRRKAEEAKRLREATLTEGTLNGTGSEPWAAMWESARTFSEELAYPGREFPVFETDARCVLCQQGISHDAGHRLKRFQAFIASTTEQELRTIRDEFVRLRKAFIDLKTTSSAVDEAINEIRIENEPVANAISSAISVNESRRKAIVAALTENTDLAAQCPALQFSDTEATALAQQLDERIRTLRSTSNEQEKKRVTAEAQELRARKLLAKHEALVLNEIERKKKVAALGLCIDDTKTKGITDKSTAVTRTAVTQRLKDSFKDELGRLGFRQVEVELSEAGGTEGVLYHNLILTRAPGVQLPKVVSEGEQRCLSIAAFFAELSTADDPSGIVFDDPVSSLDYKWRESIARRLVEEAKARQVIVFTHDIAFLFLLKQFAAEQAVEQLDQHVRQIPAKGSGICAEDMPWVAMSVGKKIRFLKNEWPRVEKLFSEGHQDAYEKEAKTLYGLLREGWERGLEEVLLAGLVERFRPNVQTKQVIDVADIKEEDCRTLDAAMTKCSKWLTGHDQAAGARAAVPEPAELKADIAALETWVSTIRTRRA